MNQLTARRVAIVPDFSEKYDQTVVAGISAQVAERGDWSLYVPADPLHRAAMLQQWTGDGVIANLDDPAVAYAVKRKRVPTVGYGGGPGLTGPRTHYLATDDEAIGELAAEHLQERGFAHFGYCAMSQALRNQPWSENRGRAFEAALRRRGQSCSVFRVSESVSQNWSLLLEALCAWIQQLERPAAIFAAYDMRALHVLEACRHLRLRVPEEVAVLGVDNDELICELAKPSLSSVVQGGYEVGVRATLLLERLMNGDAISGDKAERVKPVGVATRQSTDVLAIDDVQVATALKYVRSSACQGIQVSDVVQKTAVSRVTLEQRFKRTLGRTIHAEIKRVQLERVKELLRNTELPLHKIARQTGFEYVEYLSNLFRRVEGQTPGEYRRLHHD